MLTPGTFGYIIGKQKRLMHVKDDADLLWQILVREIYVLMKYYKSKELLKDAFEKIKIIHNTSREPSQDQINHCKLFTDYDLSESKFKSESKSKSWPTILHFCQSSYINILEAGYLINEKEEVGFTFILDFNKGIVKYYKKNHQHNETKSNENIIQIATIDEIMEYEDMPQKLYRELVSEMHEQFDIFYIFLQRIICEKEKITNLLKDARSQGAINIQEKLQTLLEEQLLEERKLHLSRRVFYQRLKALDLIDEEENK